MMDGLAATLNIVSYAGMAQVLRPALGHFNLYTGAGFERGDTLQLEFLLRVVPPLVAAETQPLLMAWPRSPA
jgi:hypothetical protein